ncbi:MAG: RICIN domain-containing protein [Caldilineaceae bacterium]|nr:RICIN domain-containing protein [Caldilineaceae bacterium]
MGHRLASSIGIWDKGAAHVNPNLMGDLIADAVVTDANSLFGTATNAAGTCDLGSAGGGRCRGFTGIAANYDAQSVQHAWIYIIYYYMKDADFLRQLAYDDLRAGVDLLKRKYDWVRRHIFRGVEFSRDNVPLPVATIINRHSGKALDVVKWDLNDHAALQQYAAHGGDNQRWALRPDGEGCYQLMAMHSGKCLDVAASSQADGAAVQLYSGHSGGNQKWSLIPDSQGYFEIVAKHSGKCLEVAGWGTADRAPVQQYARHGGANQKWRLDFAVTC